MDVATNSVARAVVQTLALFRFGTITDLRSDEQSVAMTVQPTDNGPTLTLMLFGSSGLKLVPEPAGSAAITSLRELAALQAWMERWSKS